MLGSENLPESVYAYDPSFEWPGDLETPEIPCTQSEASTSYQRQVNTFRPNQPAFRLVVLHSSILPSNQRLAVIDGHSEVQFGRDRVPSGSTTPRIRLKEMEVSKLHATAYWDSSRREWGIVDMGSVHGTFLQPASIKGDDRGVRLSPARQASIPRTLKHLDRLTIGGTTFIVHMHRNQLPCEECWITEEEDIPLFSFTKVLEAASPDEMCRSPSDFGVPSSKDAKKALTLLKHNLLARHHVPIQNANVAEQGRTQYVDRSARRRALMPFLNPIAPGVSSALIEPRLQNKPPPVEPVSSPPTPVPSTNVGHHLLIKQGWRPGTALGLDTGDGRIGLIQPLEIGSNTHRVGLGAKRSSTFSDWDSDWREVAKRQRWENTQ